MLRAMRSAFAAALVLAPLCVGCGDAPEDDTHDYVKVLFGRAENEPDNPYVGTAEVNIQMAYETCYENFYDANPNYAIDGPDGALVFGSEEDGGEGWMDRLCTETESARADCEVLEFNQLLDVAKRLTVTYRITGELENRVLLFGPLPKKDLTDCDGGISPRVRLELGGTGGVDGDGNPIWSVVSAATMTAVPGDGAELVIKGGRN